jgi:hypothetical protein
VPNLVLIIDLRKSFLQNPVSVDLVDVCLHWYRRPPKSMLPELQIQNDLGKTIRIKLKNTSVSAAW